MSVSSIALDIDRLKMTLCSFLGVRNLWQIGNLFMALFFSLASYVQHNDPDAEIWMLAYGIPAFLCVVQCVRPSISGNILWRYMTTFHLILCAFGEAYILSSSYLSSGAAGPIAQKWFEREETREFGGLLLVCLWLTLCIIQTNPNRSRSWHDNPPKSVLCLAALLVLTPFILWASMHLKSDYMKKQPDHCQGSVKMPSFQM